MHEKHPVFIEPEDETTIWRYMSFAKLVSMLHSRSLYFCRVDKLQDRYEGQLPRPTFEITAENLRCGYMATRKESIINCWSMSAHESVGLWKTYVPHNEGVVIRSTYSSLKTCFKKEGVFKEATVYIGIVNYVDFNKYNFVDETNIAFNGFIPLMHKRKFFEYEHELRAVISGLGTKFLYSIIQGVPGLGIPVSLDTLIHAIYVVPQASPWFVNTVKSLVKVYKLNPDIVSQSSLDESLYSE